MILRILRKPGFYFGLWLLSVIVFFVVLGAGTDWFNGNIYDTGFLENKIFIGLIIGSFVLGIIAFLIGSFIETYQILKKREIKHKFFKIPLFLGIFILLPICILFSSFINVLSFFIKVRTRKDLRENISFRGIVFSLFTFIFLLPTWLVSYFIFGFMVKEWVLTPLGYIKQVELISLTGSMYPTFPKSDKKDLKEQAEETVEAGNFIPYPSGFMILGNRYLGRDLKRGDIIIFENKKTDEVTKEQYGEPSGFVKRLIGLPGDTIELRDGLVYLNGKALKEQYIYKPRSTYAEDFLSECHVITVPKNNVFAMGDNRKGSGDSREIGFVNFKDISLLIPIEDQKGTLDKSWRDTSKDLDESSKIKLDKKLYLELLNKRRKEEGLKPLKYELKLEKSASIRGGVILKFDDYSLEGTRSGMSMYKAMLNSNYSNPDYGELPTEGYFEAQELLENQFEYPQTEKFVLDKDFQDIGISEVQGTVNSCPTQIIVQHLAGYVPPNYTKEDVDAWEKELIDLKGIQQGWLDLRTYGDVYDKNKKDVDRLNDIITQRIAALEGIVARMKANQWVTQEQDKFMRTTDQVLSEEEDKIATFLNDHN